MKIDGSIAIVTGGGSGLGRATAEEVRDLLEEGVDVAPLPVLPDDTN